MLSYRHAFHAGNHADVLKHYVLSLVLDYMNQKQKSYWVVDTHAGAGMYALTSEFAQKNIEFQMGITRLYDAEDLPESLGNFVNIIKNYNQNNLSIYPGSPKIAEALVRDDDKLRLFELHPSDCKLLIEQFKGKTRQTKIVQQDGFAGIKACLPPPTKRGLVLIDPPYELKDDYQRVVDCIKDSLGRFATGTYLIWYPLLQRPEPLAMVDALKKLHPDNWLDVSLSIETPNADGFGMFGSGMFVVNPPWTLPKLLTESMPVLCDMLAIDNSANFTLSHNIS
jgi:23S rRNA (adenine2030-N6)-methyltransferase